MKPLILSAFVCVFTFLGWNYGVNKPAESIKPQKPSITLWDIGFEPCLPPKEHPGLSVSNTTNDGATETLSPQAKPLVVHFWAPWCAPCRAELPHFAKFIADHPGAQVWCVADSDQTPQNIQSFYQSQKLSGLPVMIDTHQRLAQRLRVDGLPTTIFFDKEGRERGRIVGAIQWLNPDVAALIVSELLS